MLNKKRRHRDNRSAAADLTLKKTASTKYDGLRGIEGTQFRINNTSILTNLGIAFKEDRKAV